MGFFYLDDSIRDEGDFILGALIYSEEDLTPPVFEAIQDVGLTPGVDEYKSRTKMLSDPKQAALRTQLRQMFCSPGIRVGSVITPRPDRDHLGREALAALEKIVRANGLTNSSHEVFFDQGIIVDEEAKCVFEKRNSSTLFLKKNSAEVGGIQLADLAAHYMGTMLLQTLGVVDKKVKAGENSGYVPDMELSIGFELWAVLRYAFFRSPTATGNSGDETIDLRTFDHENYGLHISNSCSATLRSAAIERFGECYLGCIH